MSYSPLLDENLPLGWLEIRRRPAGFGVLFLWLLLSFVVLLAYKSNLLAMLVKSSYEQPLETFQVVF